MMPPVLSSFLVRALSNTAPMFIPSLLTPYHAYGHHECGDSLEFLDPRLSSYNKQCRCRANHVVAGEARGTARIIGGQCPVSHHQHCSSQNDIIALAWGPRPCALVGATIGGDWQ